MPFIRTFPTVQEAVDQIRGFLLNEEWEELGQYMFLEGTVYSREEVDRKYFYTLERFGPAEEQGSEKIIFPFPPDYIFCEELTISEEITAVVMEKKTGTGSGMVRQNWDWFYLLSFPTGFAVVPEKGNDPYSILNAALLYPETPPADES